MLVRNESVQQGAPSPNTDARLKSGILTSDTNGWTESRSNSRKRKIEDISEQDGAYDLFNEDFSVKVRFDLPPWHIRRFDLTRCAGIPFVST